MTKMYSFIEEKEITSVNTISLEVGLTLNQLFILFFTTIHPFIYILIQSIYVTPCSIMLKILANSIILPLSICFNHTDQYYVFDPYEFVMLFLHMFEALKVILVKFGPHLAILILWSCNKTSQTSLHWCVCVCVFFF